MEHQIIENKLVIPEGITEIGFQDIDPLLTRYPITEIHLPASLETIHDDTFFDHPDIRRINLPAGLRHIGQQAFWGLDDLEELTLPMTVETIGKHAFCNCRKLTLRVSGDSASIPAGWHKDFAPNVRIVFTSP